MRAWKLRANIIFVLTAAVLLTVLNASATRVVTGKFTGVLMDTRTPRTIDTGLIRIRVLRIYVYDSSRPAEIAYTTDQMQSDRPGMFLCQTKWLNGLCLVGSTFSASHTMFSRPGVNYYWEALGD